MLQVAEDAAEAAGFLLSTDLGARGSSQIGGILANDAGGVRVIRHNMTRDNLLGIEVVPADGTVVSTLGKPVNNNTGYDLFQLFAEPEGTLGIITRAVMRPRPLPTARCTALCALAKFADAVAMLKLARADLPGLSALEVNWKDYFSLLQQLEGRPLSFRRPASCSDHPGWNKERWRRSGCWIDYLGHEPDLTDGLLQLAWDVLFRSKVVWPYSLSVVTSLGRVSYSPTPGLFSG